MSSASQFFGGGRIKSIQRGVATTSSLFSGFQDVTITAVDTTKSILYHLGNPTGSTGSFTSVAINYTVMLTLENSTTIRANSGVSRSSSPASVSWQLVEYF